MQLNEINQLKKRLTFGNISPFYHAISTAVGQVDGFLQYGFGNNLDLLQDKTNWNYTHLGGYRDALGDIVCETSPRLSIYKVFNHKGFELHCIPWIRDEEFDFELRNRPEMDFIHWRPEAMKVILKIPMLQKFIQDYFHDGDEADLALIKFTHHLIEKMVEHLQKELNVQKVEGITIKGFYDFAEKRVSAGEDLYFPKVYDFSS